ncbi:DUF3927 family protein [Serratia plymuthica]|uniref:DUF3927 family protein n=1 Tax=Serratia plymuthica TaxID=82996 RepID=UPI0020C939C2|nr:DUF3927 family protein [Serratia plymuthica]UTN95260.1 DUF3927 family protein [Serratia plymuthica]
MITKLRWVGIGLLLFLVVAVDFTSRLMSMVADGVLVAGIMAIARPMLKTKK